MPCTEKNPLMRGRVAMRSLPSATPSAAILIATTLAGMSSVSVASKPFGAASALLGNAQRRLGAARGRPGRRHSGRRYPGRPYPGRHHRRDRYPLRHGAAGGHSGRGRLAPPPMHAIASVATTPLPTALVSPNLAAVAVGTAAELGAGRFCRRLVPSRPLSVPPCRVSPCRRLPFSLRPGRTLARRGTALLATTALAIRQLTATPVAVRPAFPPTIFFSRPSAFHRSGPCYVGCRRQGRRLCG